MTDEYDVHECLHMADFLCSAVLDQLCDHKAVRKNRKWAKLASRAADALWDLYQAIGSEHLKEKRT
jgi:hypothetical protein